MKEKRALEKVLSIYQSVQVEHMARIAQFDKWARLYHSKSNRQLYQGRANVFIPSTFEAIETLIPRIAEGVLTTDPCFSVIPREEQDIVQAKLIQALLAYQFEQMNFKINFLKFLKPLLVYGTSIAKVTWLYQTKEVLTQETYGEEPVKTTRVIYDNPIFTVVDPYDFFIDPSASTIDEADWVIQRAMVNIQDLDPEIYYNLDKLEVEKENTTTSSYQEKQARREIRGLSADISVKATPKIEVLEYWGLFDIDDDGKEEECLIVVANNRHIIRLEENPFFNQEKPFIATAWLLTAEGGFWGMGIPEVVEGLQLELNAKRNQALDNVTMTLNNMWLRDRNAGIDKRQLKSIPNGIIDADNINGLQPLRPPTSIGEAQSMISIIEEDIRRMSGATLALMGSPVPGRQTATEIQSMVTESNNRLRLHIRFIEENVMKPLLRKCYSYNQQFITEERIVRIIGAKGNEFERINPADIAGDYDFIPTASFSLANKEVIKRNFLELYNILQGNPNINQVALLKKLLEVFDIKGIEEVLVEHLETEAPAEAPAEVPTPAGRLEGAGAPMPEVGAQLAGVMGGG